MKILAADIGGTKTLVQLSRLAGDALTVLHEQRYASADFADFHQLVRHFLDSAPEGGEAIHKACLAVAGPVRGEGLEQQAQVTNLPWRIEARAFAAAFRIARVCLINDFAAVAYGIPTLGNGDLETLQAGESLMQGPCLVAGAGTGFGVAQLLWDGERHRVLPSEAGHADFAPVSPLEMELAAYLREKYGRCAIEFVLSGPGLVNIYDFLAWHHGVARSATLEARVAARDAAAISAAAEAGETLASEALALFGAIYGATLGNLALFALPRGGVYVAGGIAPRILETLRQDAFLTAFLNKGKMGALMETLPLRVVLNPRVGLLGARDYAIKYC